MPQVIKLDFVTRDENFDFGNLATSRLLANSKDEYAAYHIAELVLQETNRTALLICATTSLINEIVRTPTARLVRRRMLCDNLRLEGTEDLARLI